MNDELTVLSVQRVPPLFPSLEALFRFDFNVAFGFTKITRMFWKPLSDFQPLKSILPGLLEKLIELLKQSQNPRGFMERNARLVPNAMVIFVAIVDYIEKSPLAQMDIRDIMTLYPPAQGYFESDECLSCMEKLSDCVRLTHTIKVCALCGGFMCSPCFETWKASCLQKLDPMKRRVTCSSCRDPTFDTNLYSCKLQNIECWASIVFAITFGKDFKSLSESEKSRKDADGLPDPAFLREIMHCLYKNKKMMFPRQPLFQMVSFRRAAVRAAVVAADGASDGAADGAAVVAAVVAADGAADRAADGAADRAADGAAVVAAVVAADGASDGAADGAADRAAVVASDWEDAAMYD
jgi:hypothetical protein